MKLNERRDENLWNRLENCVKFSLFLWLSERQWWRRRAMICDICLGKSDDFTLSLSPKRIFTDIYPVLESWVGGWAIDWWILPCHVSFAHFLWMKNEFMLKYRRLSNPPLQHWSTKKSLADDEKTNLSICSDNSSYRAQKLAQTIASMIIRLVTFPAEKREKLFISLTTFSGFLLEF